MQISNETRRTRYVHAEYYRDPIESKQKNTYSTRIRLVDA